MNNQLQNDMLPQDDLLKIMLADLRRTSREYTTATTEASCPAIRSLFSELTDSTLKLQGELYKLMEQQQIYTKPAGASRKEVDQNLQEAEQACMKAKQLVAQHQSQLGSVAAHMSNVSPHQVNTKPYN
ncbi:spore coat protein [Paenibacillus antibioticophila]|uniref:spore coat protein n=1 Tax=Paenibacillus antibioticophila TaxID=1274374 RepID=UPI000B0D6D82|nr:spore coat protein [Paenibacillus antibioticophila]